MKSLAFKLFILFAFSSLVYACGPKPACGTKREKAKKYKQLKSNPNFKM